MAGNTLGKLFCVTTFGESHGPAIGCVIDGCPPGLVLSEADIQPDLDRRRPGTSRHVTQRQEADRVEILSGVFEGRTTGTPIALLIRNEDARSKDYGNIAQTLQARPRRLHLLPEVRRPGLSRRRTILGPPDGAPGRSRCDRAEMACRGARRRRARLSLATGRDRGALRAMDGRARQSVRRRRPCRRPAPGSLHGPASSGGRLLRCPDRGGRQQHPGRAGGATLRQAGCRHRPRDDGHQRRQGRRDRCGLRQRGPEGQRPRRRTDAGRLRRQQRGRGARRHLDRPGPDRCRSPSSRRPASGSRAARSISLASRSRCRHSVATTRAWASARRRSPRRCCCSW